MEVNTFQVLEEVEVVNNLQVLEEKVSDDHEAYHDDHYALHDDPDVSPFSPCHCGTLCCVFPCRGPAGTSGDLPVTCIIMQASKISEWEADLH